MNVTITNKEIRNSRLLVQADFGAHGGKSFEGHTAEQISRDIGNYVRLLEDLPKELEKVPASWTPPVTPIPEPTPEPTEEELRAQEIAAAEQELEVEVERAKKERERAELALADTAVAERLAALEALKNK